MIEYIDLLWEPDGIHKIYPIGHYLCKRLAHVLCDGKSADLVVATNGLIDVSNELQHGIIYASGMMAISIKKTSMDIDNAYWISFGGPLDFSSKIFWEMEQMLWQVLKNSLYQSHNVLNAVG